MFRVSNCICWQTENKTCQELVLDIAQSVLSQVSRIFKLQEKELPYLMLDRLKDQARLIKNCRKIVYAEF